MPMPGYALIRVTVQFCADANIRKAIRRDRDDFMIVFIDMKNIVD